MTEKLTEEQKQKLFQAMVEDISDMTAKDIVRTYLWPEHDDEETLEMLWEEYFGEEEDEQKG